MDLSNFEHRTSRSLASFELSLTLSVESVDALWRAAADRALAAPGMTPQDVDDTIGPREDPSIHDCIAMLAAPGAIAGCVLDDLCVCEVAVSGTPYIRLPAAAIAQLGMPPAAHS